MNRITKKEVLDRIEFLNKILAEKGIYKIHLGERYNYKAIDVYYINKNSMKETIRCGIGTREAYNIVSDMIKGIELYTESKTKVVE